MVVTGGNHEVHSVGGTESQERDPRHSQLVGDGEGHTGKVLWRCMPCLDVRGRLQNDTVQTQRVERLISHMKCKTSGIDGPLICS